MRLIDLDQRASTQHGLVTLEQSGLSRAGWYRALKSGRFEQVHPGVARLAGTPRTYRQRIAAAVLAASAPRTDAGARSGLAQRSVVVQASHRSAASLLLGAQSPPPATTDWARRPVDLDLGAVAPEEVHPLLGHALATKMVTLDAVETVLDEHARPGRSGIVALRTALDDWAIDAKPADSVLEIAFHQLVAKFDLPAVEFHPVVEGWEVDFRFVGTRLLVECDGWATHGLVRRQFERDRRRDADLSAAGWVISRHSYRAITRDRAATARRLRALLGAVAA